MTTTDAVARIIAGRARCPCLNYENPCHFCERAAREAIEAVRAESHAARHFVRSAIPLEYGAAFVRKP